MLPISVLMEENQEESSKKENRGQYEDGLSIFSQEAQGHDSFTVMEEGWFGKR